MQQAWQRTCRARSLPRRSWPPPGTQAPRSGRSSPWTASSARSTGARLRQRIRVDQGGQAHMRPADRFRCSTIQRRKVSWVATRMRWSAGPAAGACVCEPNKQGLMPHAAATGAEAACSRWRRQPTLLRCSPPGPTSYATTCPRAPPRPVSLRLAAAASPADACMRAWRLHRPQSSPAACPLPQPRLLRAHDRAQLPMQALHSTNVQHVSSPVDRALSELHRPLAADTALHGLTSSPCCVQLSSWSCSRRRRCMAAACGWTPQAATCCARCSPACWPARRTTCTRAGASRARWAS